MRTLAGAAVVADEGLASFVEFGVHELASLVGVPVVRRWEDGSPRVGPVVIVVGAGANAAAGLPAIATPTDPGPDGYVISEHVRPDGTVVVAVVGSDDQGTKYGLLDLIRSLRKDGDGWALPAGLSRRTSPAFSLRAMYAHLHWSFNRPYALRSWTGDDWKRYVDLLSHFGVNVLQVWPMLALMPVPLSDGDESYLGMLADVVRYAQECRGMQVWVGECANNLAATDHGQPIAEREYFGTERLVDPGTAEGLSEIRESRDAFFSRLAAADGHWIIDSDPGQWPGSPASEFVDVVVENQRLARSHNPAMRTVYWMHVGWGTGDRRSNFDAILAGLKDRLDEPWSILLGALPEHVPAVQAAGLADRVVWFPYGWIEGEPTPPLTQLSFEVVDAYLDLAAEHGYTRAMGQAQTPIVQLPKLWYLFRCLWSPELRREDPRDRLEELGALLYPDYGSTVAEAWDAMRGTDATRLGAARDALAKAVDVGLGEPGPLGRLLFGDPSIVAVDLLAQIAIRHEGEAFREAVVERRGVAEVQERFTAYLRAALRWRERHGYVPMGGHKFVYGPYLEPGLDGWNRYYDEHGFMHAYPEVQWIPKARLIAEGEFHWALIDGVLTEVASGPDARRFA